MKVKATVKIKPNQRLDANQLASRIIQAVLDLDKKRRRCEFEETKEEQNKATIK